MQVRIYAIGMGGIGSFLMAPLSKMVQHGSLNKWRLESLVLVDGDSYTDSNLSRQFFPRACSGMNKAMAQQVVLNALADPEQEVRVAAIPSFVLRKNIHTILPMPSCFPVIISMVDNHECRKILSEHCASSCNHLRNFPATRAHHRRQPDRRRKRNGSGFSGGRQDGG